MLTVGVMIVLGRTVRVRYVAVVSLLAGNNRERISYKSEQVLSI